MTDRELLELAAKAAGLVTYGLADKFLVEPGHRTGGFIVGTPTGRDVPWNPLTDDGDALRLAVKLQMFLDPGIKDITAVCLHDDRRFSAWEPLNPDPYAATRRAIVRAAAAIGQSQEGRA
jgi:hypothetical protein